MGRRTKAGEYYPFVMVERAKRMLLGLLFLDIETTGSARWRSRPQC